LTVHNAKNVAKQEFHIPQTKGRAMASGTFMTRRKWYLVCFGAVGALVLLFVLVGPPQLLARSETPNFCSGCHTMQSNFEAWFHAGAHRRKLCVDCHLPNENMAAHYLWKSLDGVKDLVLFYSGMASEHVKLSAHSTSVLQSNCIRCHSSTAEFIDHGRKCWECHRRIMHTRSGAMATN
jgi:cytochrome c nitrite reductase small subunit